MTKIKIEYANAFTTIHQYTKQENKLVVTEEERRNGCALSSECQKIITNTGYHNLCHGLGGKNGRGMRLSQYDPDDPMSPSGGVVPQSYNSLDNPSRPPVTAGNRVSTICNNYTEKTMLLSSDEDN